MKAASIEAQTWRNVPPFPTATLFRASCNCGWRGLWFNYRDNARADALEHNRGHRP